MSADLLLRACGRKPTDRTPVWFMRQAGRYLPEYRAIRAKRSLLEICHMPELAAEVAIQPVNRFGFDAAIIFADILLPFEPLGLGVSFEQGEGPVIARPIRSAQDVAGLRELEPESDLAHVLEAVRLLATELEGRVPVIGFGGAPFTLASYAIEGGATKSFTRTKQFMYTEPGAWHALLSSFANFVGRYLAAQAKAGAAVLQLFDSWAGCLSSDDYDEFAAPHSRTAIALARAQGTPIIHFGTGTAALLDQMAHVGGDVIGVDWRMPLDRAWAHFPDRGIQGNLDPVALFAPRRELEARVRDVLKRAARRPGHIFNLGHGILPETPLENVAAVVELVQESSSVEV